MKGKIRPSILIAAIIAGLFLFCAILVVLTEILNPKKPKEPTAQASVVESTTQSSTLDTTTVTTTVETDSTLSEEQTTDQPQEWVEPILIYGGVASEYSDTVTLNVGTELEETRNVYVLPAGEYTISNILNKPVQVNIYSKETVKQGEWEEPARSKVKLLMEKGSFTVTIENGDYIYLVGNDSISAVPQS